MNKINKIKKSKMTWSIKWLVFKHNIKGLFCIHHYLVTGGGCGPDGIYTSYRCKHCGKCIYVEGNKGVMLTHK